MANSQAYNFPHTEVVINDNSRSLVSTPIPTNGVRMLCVIESPRGVDGKIQTIRTGRDEFVKKFGMGPFSKYGQPLLNAYIAASTDAATLHVLRVTGANDKRANLHVYAAYKIETIGTEGVDAGSDPWNTVPQAANKVKRMKVQFLATTTSEQTGLTSVEDLVKVGEGSPAEKAKPTLDGYTVLHLFSVAATGKGEFGNNLAIRIAPGTRDKTMEFKTHEFIVFENNEFSESVNVCFYPDAILGKHNYAADVQINDDDKALDNLRIGVNYNNFADIADKYATEVLSSITAVPEVMAAYRKAMNMSEGKAATELDAALPLDPTTFDVLTGMNKNLMAMLPSGGNPSIINYVIEAIPEEGGKANLINPQATAGNKLLSGVGDGSLTSSERDEVYSKAFRGEIDPMIKSTNRYKVDMILDANYSAEVKKELIALTIQRSDCICYLDCGNKLDSKESPLQLVESYGPTSVDRLISIDGYKATIVDPYAKRLIDVSSTALLADHLPRHFFMHNGKHIPFAGGKYGAMPELRAHNIFPVMDESLDKELMNEMYNSRINYAQVTPKGTVIRATQQTRQAIASNLSELSNMHIILDIKRDCEELVAQNNYNFFSARELAAFNKDAQELLRKYGDTQVEDITATFDSSDFEEEQGILHLYIDVRHKKLIKSAKIDININK